MWKTQTSSISSATPQTIWKLYEDVTNWKNWDVGIQDSTLETTFSVGSSGTLRPNGSLIDLPFLLTKVIPLEVFVDITPLPNANITFTHTLEVVPEGTRITHSAEISGLDWQKYATTIGQKIEIDLPKAVETLAILAANL